MKLHIEPRISLSALALLAPTLPAVALIALALLNPRFAQSQATPNASPVVALANDLGCVEPTKEINLTVVLQLHNPDSYGAAVEALYDPASPTYHQWFAAQDFARYAPTPAEFETVEKELLKHGLTIVSTDPDRYSIRVHGAAANAEAAFQTEIHTFEYMGRMMDAHVSDARLTGDAGELVSSVAGLERHKSNTARQALCRGLPTSAPSMGQIQRKPSPLLLTSFGPTTDLNRYSRTAMTEPGKPLRWSRPSDMMTPKRMPTRQLESSGCRR
jgi:subtilase family serine protease